MSAVGACLWRRRQGWSLKRLRTRFDFQNTNVPGCPRPWRWLACPRRAGRWRSAAANSSAGRAQGAVRRAVEKSAVLNFFSPFHTVYRKVRIAEFSTLFPTVTVVSNQLVTILLFQEILCYFCLIYAKTRLLVSFDWKSFLCKCSFQKHH